MEAAAHGGGGGTSNGVLVVLREMEQVCAYPGAERIVQWLAAADAAANQASGSAELLPAVRACATYLEQLQNIGADEVNAASKFPQIPADAFVQAALSVLFVHPANFAKDGAGGNSGGAEGNSGGAEGNSGGALRVGPRPSSWWSTRRWLFRRRLSPLAMATST